MDEGKTCAATAARALCADARNAHKDARDANRQKRRSGTNSRRVFRKISHAPYHGAKILFYFCATNFFRSAFSSLATRKNEASSPPSATSAKRRNSTLWALFKNKPTFRKNTTTFLTFSTGLKQGITTRRNNIRPEVKFLAHFTPSHAHHARITRASRFSDFCLHSFTYPFNTLTNNTLQVKASPSSAFTFLHPFSPSPPLHR